VCVRLCVGVGGDSAHAQGRRDLGVILELY